MVLPFARTCLQFLQTPTEFDEIWVDQHFFAGVPVNDPKPNMSSLNLVDPSFEVRSQRHKIICYVPMSFSKHTRPRWFS